MSVQYYYHSSHFQTEAGAILPSLKVAYHTYGELSPAKDNVIWVCHALTANSDVADWWPHTVERGKFLDPSKYFIVCANILGSHYGTTGPLSLNDSTGEPYYGSFPIITVRDAVEVYKLLARHLGISDVEMLIGSSIGGFQAMEWAISDPYFAKRLALIATSAQSSPWAIATNESQRLALLADSTFGELSADAGMKGLKAARSMALLVYRGQKAYDATQQDSEANYKTKDFRVTSYQQYQGEKLCSRFNAYSYFRLTQLQDSHNVGRGRAGVERALSLIKAKTLLVCITSDILYPLVEHTRMYNAIENAELQMISSDYGHDGFLIEHEKLDALIKRLLAS